LTRAQNRRRQRGDHAAGKLTVAKKSVQRLEAVMELEPPTGSAVKAEALFLVLHFPGGLRQEISDVKLVERQTQDGQVSVLTIDTDGMKGSALQL
jgi:hypothetical protein